MQSEQPQLEVSPADLWVIVLYSDYRKETHCDVYGIYPRFEDALSVADELTSRGRTDPDPDNNNQTIISDQYMDNDSDYVVPPPRVAYDKRLVTSQDNYKRLRERGGSWTGYLRVSIVPAPMHSVQGACARHPSSLRGLSRVATITADGAAEHSEKGGLGA